jgi:hypothetical protein
MLGKTVWNSSPDVKSANKVNVDLSSEAEGVYLVHLIGDGKSEVRKISVQR